MSIKKISPKVRNLLWAKSAGRCEFNVCNKPLWRDELTHIELNFSDVAHIIGNSPDGPRGDVILSEEYCNDLSNLMLMCLDHHRMIDQITKIYSDEVLREMKDIHEERIERLTEIKPDKTPSRKKTNSRYGEIATTVAQKTSMMDLANAVIINKDLSTATNTDNRNSNQ